MASFSGLFDDVHNTPYALQSKRPTLHRKINRLLRRTGGAELKELLLTVNGVVVGSTALAQRHRVEAVSGLTGFVMGGARTIETVDKINRATVTADTTEIAAILNEQSDANAYPVDAAGDVLGANA